MARSAVLLAPAVLFPGAAAAHDAFGDLGPFYANLLHPLADPAQGLVVAAAGVTLARQPLPTVRPAYAALAAAGALTVALHGLLPIAGPGLRATALIAAALAGLALSGRALPAAVAAPVAAGAAAIAGLAIDLPPGLRSGALAAFGGAAGIALLALLVWGGVDLAERRIGRVAGAVAASWIAAIAVMAAALPA